MTQSSGGLNIICYKKKQKSWIGQRLAFSRKGYLKKFSAVLWFYHWSSFVGTCCCYVDYNTLIEGQWLCFRYDARLHLTDKAQFIAKPSDGVPSLTPEEEEIERLCDEERYMDLNRDMEEYESQQGKFKHAFIHLWGTEELKFILLIVANPLPAMNRQRFSRISCVRHF